MDKIYSRPRIKLPKIFFNSSKIDKDKIRKIFTIIAILLKFDINVYEKFSFSLLVFL